MNNQKIQPQSIEAEISVLGAMLMDKEAIIGRECVQLFLAWREGKITQTDFRHKLRLIQRQIADKQLALKFEK